MSTKKGKQGDRMSRFDETFEEVLRFVPEGLYLSRNLYTQKEAAKAFSNHISENLTTDDIEEAYVRFSFVPEDLRDELGDSAWLTCDKDIRGAQPCWQYTQ